MSHHEIQENTPHHYTHIRKEHIIGCSTPSHPTKKFIEAHASLYASTNTFPIVPADADEKDDSAKDTDDTGNDSKSSRKISSGKYEDDDAGAGNGLGRNYLRYLYNYTPLKAVPRGGGRCQRHSDCGYEHNLGYCDVRSKRCVCRAVRPLANESVSDRRSLSADKLTDENDHSYHKKHHSNHSAEAHGNNSSRNKTTPKVEIPPKQYDARQFTGPYCLAAKGFDDIDWEKEDSLVFYYLRLPTALICLVAILVVLLAGTVLGQYFHYQALLGKSQQSGDESSRAERQSLLGGGAETDSSANQQHGNILGSLSPNTRRNLLSSNTSTFTALNQNNISSDYSNYQSLSTSNMNSGNTSSQATPRPYQQ